MIQKTNKYIFKRNATEGGTQIAEWSLTLFNSCSDAL